MPTYPAARCSSPPVSQHAYLSGCALQFPSTAPSPGVVSQHAAVPPLPIRLRVAVPLHSPGVVRQHAAIPSVFAWVNTPARVAGVNTPAPVAHRARNRTVSPSAVGWRRSLLVQVLPIRLRVAVSLHSPGVVRQHAAIPSVLASFFEVRQTHLLRWRTGRETAGERTPEEGTRKHQRRPQFAPTSEHFLDHKS